MASQDGFNDFGFFYHANQEINEDLTNSEFENFAKVLNPHAGEDQLKNLPGSFPWESKEAESSTNKNLQSTAKQPIFAPPSLGEVKEAANQLTQGNTDAAEQVANSDLINLGGIELSVMETALIGVLIGVVWG